MKVGFQAHCFQRKRPLRSFKCNGANPTCFVNVLASEAFEFRSYILESVFPTVHCMFRSVRTPFPFPMLKSPSQKPPPSGGRHAGKFGKWNDLGLKLWLAVYSFIESRNWSETHSLSAKTSVTSRPLSHGSVHYVSAAWRLTRCSKQNTNEAFWSDIERASTA